MWGGPKSKEISAWSGVFEKKSVVSAGTVGKSRRCATFVSAMSRKRTRRGWGWILSTEYYGSKVGGYFVMSSVRGKCSKSRLHSVVLAFMVLGNLKRFFRIVGALCADFRVFWHGGGQIGWGVQTVLENPASNGRIVLYWGPVHVQFAVSGARRRHSNGRHERSRAQESVPKV